MKRRLFHWLPVAALGCALVSAQTTAPAVAPAETNGWPAAAQAKDRAPADPARDNGDAPHGRLPAELELAPGTWIAVRVNEMVSSNSARPGDLFSATLTQPLIADGVVAARRGQMVTGRVTDVVRAGKVKGSSRLGVELTELTLADGRQAGIHTQLVRYAGGTSKGRDATAVGTAAGVGAAIGAVAGGGVGAGAGAGAGAAAGLAGVLLTRGRQTVLYPEDVVTFRLTDPVVVNTERAPLAFRYAQQSDYEHANAQRPSLRQRRTVRPPYYAGWGYPGWGWGPYWGPGWGPGWGWYSRPRAIVHPRGWRR